jgi:hypothetical protein
LEWFSVFLGYDILLNMNAGLKKIRIALWIVLVMTVLIVVIGGITRLTGSGLSMVDWRPLMGSVPPLSEAEWDRVFSIYQQYPEYQIHQNMTLSGFKRIFFWEYLHRIVARVIGLLAFIPLILSFWAPPIENDSPQGSTPTHSAPSSNPTPPAPIPKPATSQTQPAAYAYMPAPKRIESME